MKSADRFTRNYLERSFFINDAISIIQFVRRYAMILFQVCFCVIDGNFSKRITFNISIIFEDGMTENFSLPGGVNYYKVQEDTFERSEVQKMSKRMLTLFTAVIILFELGGSFGAWIPEMKSRRVPRSRYLSSPREQAVILSGPWFGGAEESSKSLGVHQKPSYNFSSFENSWEISNAARNPLQPLRGIEQSIHSSSMPQQNHETVTRKYYSNLPFRRSREDFKLIRSTSEKSPSYQGHLFDSDLGWQTLERPQNAEKLNIVHGFVDNGGDEHNDNNKYSDNFPERIKKEVSKPREQGFLSISDAELENLVTRAIVAARKTIREIQDAEENQPKLFNVNNVPIEYSTTSQEIAEKVIDSPNEESAPLPSPFTYYVPFSIYEDTKNENLSEKNRREHAILEQDGQPLERSENKTKLIEIITQKYEKGIGQTSTEQAPENTTSVSESPQKQMASGNIQKIPVKKQTIIEESNDSIKSLKNSLTDLMAVVENLLKGQFDRKPQTSTPETVV